MHAVANPNRIKMLEFIKENPGTYISQIAERTSVDRSTVAYHLGLLEKLGLVRSNYVILEEPHSMGKAGRVYYINEEEIEKISKAVTKYLFDLSDIKDSVFSKPKETC